MPVSLLLVGCSPNGITPIYWGILGALLLIILVVGWLGYQNNKKYREQVIKAETGFYERIFQIEQQRRELESLYRADDEIRRHFRLEEVLQSLVKTAVELLHADKGSLLVWDEDKQKLRARASHGFDPGTVAQIAIAQGQGLAGRVAISGEPAIVEDTSLDEHVTPFIVKAEKLRALMQVPIRVAGEVFGVFSADYLQPHQFSEGEEKLLMAFAQRAGLAIETARLFEREEQITVMQERNRLARDLHDSVTQSMYGVSLFAEVALQLLKSGELEKTRQNLQELKEMALGALGEMRLLIYELRPSVFEQEGLLAAIQARLDSVEARVGLETNLIIEGKIALPVKIEEGLYRIAQEALNNVLKHSHAKTVTVSLRQDQQAVTLEIADDGDGFDPVQACETGCMGIHGMQERAAEMNAEFEIISQAGQGASVKVRRLIE